MIGVTQISLYLTKSIIRFTDSIIVIDAVIGYDTKTFNEGFSIMGTVEVMTDIPSLDSVTGTDLTVP